MFQLKWTCWWSNSFESLKMILNIVVCQNKGRDLFARLLMNQFAHKKKSLSRLSCLLPLCSALISSPFQPSECCQSKTIWLFSISLEDGRKRKAVAFEYNECIPFMQTLYYCLRTLLLLLFGVFGPSHRQLCVYLCLSEVKPITHCYLNTKT